MVSKIRLVPFQVSDMEERIRDIDANHLPMVSLVPMRTVGLPGLDIAHLARISS